MYQTKLYIFFQRIIVRIKSDKCIVFLFFKQKPPGISEGIYLFIFFGCVGSLFLREGSLQLLQAGTTPHRGARASHHRGLSRFRAQAPDAQAQQLGLTGLVAPRHVGSSQTRARTRVPRIGRQILNHCATREALYIFVQRNNHDHCIGKFEINLQDLHSCPKLFYSGLSGQYTKPY